MQSLHVFQDLVLNASIIHVTSFTYINQMKRTYVVLQITYVVSSSTIFKRTINIKPKRKWRETFSRNVININLTRLTGINKYAYTSGDDNSISNDVSSRIASACIST